MKTDTLTGYARLPAGRNARQGHNAFPKWRATGSRSLIPRLPRLAAASRKRRRFASAYGIQNEATTIATHAMRCAPRHAEEPQEVI